jgi:hypothetical protein
VRVTGFFFADLEAAVAAEVPASKSAAIANTNIASVRLDMMYLLNAHAFAPASLRRSASDVQSRCPAHSANAALPGRAVLSRIDRSSARVPERRARFGLPARVSRPFWP